MPSVLFVNPPLVLDEDFIDYPYFANHGLLACAALAARAGAAVDVTMPLRCGSGRHRRTEGGFILGGARRLRRRLPDGRTTWSPRGFRFLRIEGACGNTR
jgi:hypothetical protein